MSAANLHLHLLLLADQRIEHEDEGKEVEVDGQADLEEHDVQLLLHWRSIVLGSSSCLNCVSVCSVGDTQVTLHNFLGSLDHQGCSLLLGRIGWTDQLQREELS